MGSPSPRKDPDIRAEDTDEVVGSLLLLLSVRVGTRSWGQHLQKGTQASKVGMWTRPWGQSLQEETHISRWGSPITAVTCHEWPQASAHTEGGGKGGMGRWGKRFVGPFGGFGAVRCYFPSATGTTGLLRPPSCLLSWGAPSLPPAPGVSCAPAPLGGGWGEKEGNGKRETEAGTEVGQSCKSCSAKQPQMA